LNKDYRKDWYPMSKNDMKNYKRAIDLLNHRQQKFIYEYIYDYNAKQAYIRAGYKTQGNAAEANACKLLRSDRVRQAIKDLEAEYEPDYREEKRRLIAKFVDKAINGNVQDEKNEIRAMEGLAKILGLFQEKRETTIRGDDKSPVQVKQNMTLPANIIDQIADVLIGQNNN